MDKVQVFRGWEISFSLLDLFSGIGGFSLAAQWVWGDELEIECFVEIDPFCQKVLRKNFPGVPIYDDIKKIQWVVADATNDGCLRYSERKSGRKEEKGGVCEFRAKITIPTIDLLTGGFPCQPFSCAGKRAGMEDDRYLWPEMLRAIREIKPRWVVAENVPGLLTLQEGMVFEGVCADLEAEGYEVLPLVIPACAKGAPHRRDRVWIVADNKCRRQLVCGLFNGNNSGQYSERYESRKDAIISGNWQEHWYAVATRLCRVDDGISPQLDGGLNEEGTDEKELRKLREGNDSTKMEERKARQFVSSKKILQQQMLRDSESPSKSITGDNQEKGSANGRSQNMFSMQEDSKYSKTSRRQNSEGYSLPRLSQRRSYEVRDMGKVKDRNERLKSLGNAIVPQVVAEIFRAIKEIDSK